MKEQLDLLIKLQVLDLALVKVKKIEEEHPQLILSLEKSVEQERKKIISQEKQLDELRKQRIRKEQTLAMEEDKINKAKERLATVKTNKEYQAALKEIEILKSQTSQLEEDILIHMEQYDECKNTLAQLEQQITLTLKRAEEKKKELEAKLDEAQRQNEEIQKMRDTLLSQISPELLEQYHKIKQKRGEPAVVPVEGSCCQGCHLNIPPQLFNEVKRCDIIIKCPHCHRFLYWEGNHEATTTSFHSSLQ